MEEEPPCHVPEPEVPVSVPVVEKPAFRQSSRVRSEPARYGFQHMELHISVKKGLQWYDDKAQSSIITELLQLVDKKVFTSVEGWKVQPDQLKKAVQSYMFVKEKYIPKVTSTRLRPG